MVPLRIGDPAQHVHFLEQLRIGDGLFLAVQEREMSIAGKVRLSETLRSRIGSALPAPLNSSKITSSIRSPASTSAAQICCQPRAIAKLQWPRVTFDLQTVKAI
jgi:hypothetical protein